MDHEIVRWVLDIVVVFVAVFAGIWLLDFVRRPRVDRKADNTANAAVVALVADRDRRQLPVVQREPSCEVCMHFDLNEGQAIIAREAIFAEVTRQRSPAQMQPVKFDADGKVLPQESPLPATMKWTQFGACMHHQELRWSGDKCPDLKLAE